MDKFLKTRSLLTEISVKLDSSRGALLEMWRDAVASDPSLEVASDWTRKQFDDHFPDVLEAFSRALRAWPDVPTLLVSDEQHYATAHARTRWLQGYTLTGVIREWGHLNQVVLDHLARCVGSIPGADAGVHGIGSTVWARVLNDQQSMSAREYHELEKAEAETRGAELERLLAIVRDEGQARGRALETLASEMRNDLQLVLTSHSLGRAPGDWAQTYELEKLTTEGFRGLERALVDMVTLANLEAGLERTELSRFDAGHGFELLAEGMRHLGAAKGIEVTAIGPAPFLVEGDAERVRRIAKHLLFCALRAPNATRATLSWGGDEHNPARWFLVVEHSVDPAERGGGGSAGAALSNASDAKHEVEGVEAFGYREGLGQGAAPVAAGDGVDLLITKHLCELLGASLEVQTAPSRVAYRVTLPLDRALTSESVADT